jgi:hypothetical protein
VSAAWIAVILERREIGCLLPLLAGHLLADFPLQPDAWIDQRRERGWRAPPLYLNGALAALLGWLFVARWGAWWILPLVGATHILIDGAKARGDDGARAFLLDQAAHFAVLLGAAWLLARDAGAPAAPERRAGWALACAALLVWWAGGVLVGKATRRWHEQLPDDGKRTLPDAGLWIGRLERSLAFLFVLLGQFAAIGFLITAKSVLRIGEVARGGDRREAEYILIGTMLSFLLAIVIGLATRLLLGLPPTGP